MRIKQHSVDVCGNGAGQRGIQGGRERPLCRCKFFAADAGKIEPIATRAGKTDLTVDLTGIAAGEIDAKRPGAGQRDAAESRAG